MSNDRHDPNARFLREVDERIARQSRNDGFKATSLRWLNEADACGYEYNFSWMGRPIIQYPQDIVAMQEIIWRTRPDLIVETGVAHGGTTIFYASMLDLIGNGGRVVGIDVDIRAHNRAGLEDHPVFKNGRIVLLEGSSTDPQVVERVRALAAGQTRVLVCLDSDHSHDHVLAELRTYSPLVRAGQYVVVFDTSIDVLAREDYGDRPWGRGDSPMTAVAAFLQENHRFVPDEAVEAKLLITSAPNGFLLCVED